MTRAQLILLAACAGLPLASPATAQMNMNMPGMSMPGMKMPAATKPTAKKAVSRTPSKKKQTAMTKKGASAKQPRKQPRSPSKAAKAPHDMSSMPGMTMPTDHDMKDMPGMAMPTTPAADESGTNLPAGNAPPPPVPTDHAADQAYGASAMAMGRHHLGEFHGGQRLSQVMLNVADYHFKRGRDGYQWVGQAWYGGDLDRLWIKSQGDGEVKRGVARAEVQALYSHAIGPYFNLQGGVRYDFKPNPSRTYATIGIEGLAPSFFDIEAALFLSNKGELMGRVEGTVDQRITQRLILQPRVEINAAAQSSRSIGVGSGLSDIEAGFRLRYDIRREFSPYVGIQYKRAFGTTGRYLRDAGERRGGWSVVTGIRTWF
ncbi:copper resistance protein B [Sphingomonas sp.]|uniref:copper resistance protein B n=1 Tax=Sphingomonas sp. TaxID=28214 RepID=UPI00286A6028|nr:copper resistance protein B [Sphingomonas sp.]